VAQISFAPILKEETFSKMHHRKFFIKKLYVHKDYITFNTSLRQQGLSWGPWGRKKKGKKKNKS